MSFADAAVEKHIGNPVCLFVKDRPGNLAAVKGGGGGLDQLILLPGDTLLFLQLRVDLNEGNFLSV